MMTVLTVAAGVLLAIAIIAFWRIALVVVALLLALLAFAALVLWVLAQGEGGAAPAIPGTNEGILVSMLVGGALWIVWRIYKERGR